jgi:hypothetical protein
VTLLRRQVECYRGGEIRSEQRVRVDVRFAQQGAIFNRSPTVYGAARRRRTSPALSYWRRKNVLMAVAPDLIESRNQITDLVHRYAYNVRHRLKAESGALFCSDIEFVVRELTMGGGNEPTVRSHVSGRAETLEYMQRGSAALSLCPLIHNLLIDIDGLTARSTCVMENRTWPAIPGLIGEYDDTFRFEDRWLFASRVYTMFVD